MHVYGRGWDRSSRLSQIEMIEMMNRTKIALNFSSSAGSPHLKFLKGRVFEIPATGALLLTEKCEGIEEYFEVGSEIDIFDNSDELLEKLRTLLSNNCLRDKIARSGKEKVLKKYTFEYYLNAVI